ncbi:MAG: hypothetical protein CL600_01115 [Alteromonas sp.]|jgi:membrane fusion protein|uniref:HlyD family secretion protein n=1 Tax=unclassified Alteromonas TaxID=2614992 RepID=UPI000903EAF0|nr:MULTISPECIES: HlyD family efflux transporter periplasmic adaptor subunit [unclassified Alteromonas]APE07129.1 hypothetical protein BM528_16210 [Alteromonas sp. RW2A1]AUC89746.1 hypothetical protein CW735_17455 [Alteromonas sp. MB-3u-76]MAI63476.1 hypothetical protein [Alteromonas sp.]
MRKGLFRQEAINQQSTSIGGRLLMTPKPAYMMITAILVCWLVAASLFLMHGSYARKASVHGWIEPQGGVFKLYAGARNGRVSQVLVAEGQYVKRGDALIKVNYSGKNASGNQVSEILLRELKEKQHRTQGIVERLGALHKAGLADLNTSIEQLSEELRELEALVDIATHQHEVTQAQFEKAHALYRKGYVSQVTIQEQQIKVLGSEQNLKLSEQNLSAAENKISSLIRERTSLPNRQQNELAKYQNTLSDLNQQILAHTSESEQIIYAPKAGIISGLHIKPGYDINSNHLLATLVPQSSAMQAHMLVPVHSAGFIDEGQRLHIRYDAFPYQKFGVQPGQIRNISKTLILPGELHSAPVGSSEPAYLVTADVINNTLMAYGKQIELKSGMTFSADIQLSQRTLLEWFLEPLYSLSGRL